MCVSATKASIETVSFQRVAKVWLIKFYHLNLRFNHITRLQKLYKGLARWNSRKNLLRRESCDIYPSRLA